MAEGVSNVHPWLNHDLQVADLNDSRFQDIESHVEGDNKGHQERLASMEGHPAAWQHGTVKGEVAK